MKKWFAFCCTVALLLAGCNTVAGVGKDVQVGGAAIERAAH